MTEKELTVKDGRVLGVKNIQMIAIAASLLCPETAILLGKTVSLKRMGVCGHIIKNCTDLSESLQQFVRYQRLIYVVSNFRIMNKKPKVVIEHRINTPAFNEYRPILVELAFSAITTVLSEMVEKDFPVLEFRFTSSKPKAHLHLYKETFNGRLKFNQEMDAIVVDADQLNRRIPQSQDYVKKVMVKHAERLLEDIGETVLLVKVEQIIQKYLPMGVVDIEMVSAKLNMSRWTLNRKLKNEGTSFKELLNLIRKKQAFYYLADKKISVSETEFLLVFSELSAFSRAFKKWTGKNPSETNGSDYPQILTS